MKRFAVGMLAIIVGVTGTVWMVSVNPQAKAMIGKPTIAMDIDAMTRAATGLVETDLSSATH